MTARVRATGGRTPGQKRWLERQLNDPYVAAAQKAGYRSRAAFKLIELDEKFSLFRPGLRVVDLGAAPGGWTQVALARGAGRVIAVDLLQIDPIPPAVILQGDFKDSAMPARIEAALGGPAALVLSDMAANTTGHAATDVLRTTALAEAALEFVLAALAPGGSFVCKLFQGGAERRMLDTLKNQFARVRHAKPPASRKESRELYVVATERKALF